MSDWISKRFRPTYPGFEVEVRDGEGRRLHGNTKLRSARADT